MFNPKKEADLTVRESLKRKLLNSQLGSVVDVTPAELMFSFGPGFNALVAEVAKELAQRDKPETTGHPMDGCSRDQEFQPSSVAGVQQDQRDLNATREPDHKAYLAQVDNQVKAPVFLPKEVTFEEAVKPLIKWMAENHCPHSHIVVSGTSAELFHGMKSFNTFEYLRD
jgi:hypothetical protein